MPKTIMKIRTWGCVCGYHQDFEPTDELMVKHFGRIGGWCPSCQQVNLIKEADPNKKITFTIMGEEDIETEISEELATPGKRGIDVSTEAKKGDYRAKRRLDIIAAVTRAKTFEDI